VIYAAVGYKKVKSNYNALQLLKDAKPILRKAIIKNCNPELVNCICECVVNTLKGTLNLSSCATNKLKKRKRQLRTVADKKVPLATKRKIILQRGGFLGPMLAAVLPTLASILFSGGRS
jgi:hypothetical protein